MTGYDAANDCATGKHSSTGAACDLIAATAACDLIAATAACDLIAATAARP
jgi:hypothetical protein